MNLALYFYLARRWLLLAGLPALLVASLAYVYTAGEAKQYQASATMYVQQPSNQSSIPGSTDIVMSQQVIPTYTQMISSPIIASKVDRDMAARFPGYKLEGHALKVSGSAATAISAGQPQTQLITLTVSDSVPARAAAAANTVARAFIAQITSIQHARFLGAQGAIQQQMNNAQANIQSVSQRIAAYSGTAGGLNNLRAELSAYQSIYQSLLSSNEQFMVNRDTALNAVKVFSPAQIPASPVGPHPARTALLAGFIALLLCVGGVYIYDYLDDTPRTPEEIEEVVDAPILGTVQQFDTRKQGGRLVTARDARSPLSEAYRVIRTNLQFTHVDEPIRSVVVTSCSPSEGKSTTVSNLAHVFAEGGRRVTLVDADLRRPSLHQIFETERHDGLTNLLVHDTELNGHGSQPTSRDNLALVASGPLPPRPADLLGSNRMRDVVKHLGNRCDMVLMDSPPVLAVTDAAILSTIADGVILVVDPGKSKRRDLRRTREAIDAVGGRVLGVVINRLSKQASSYYYYYYQHNYSYEYQYNYGSGSGSSPAGIDLVGGGTVEGAD